MVLSVIAIGSVALAGSAAAIQEENVTDAQVNLGSYDESLTDDSSVLINESNRGEFGTSGSATISLNDGLTWNNSSTNPTVRQTTEGSISNARLTDSQTLEFDYSGLNASNDNPKGFGGAEYAQFEFAALAVDVPANDPSEFTGLNTTMDVRVGVSTAEADIKLASPSFAVDSNNDSGSGFGQSQVSVGAASSSSDFSTNITLNGTPGQIGADTEIALIANESKGITFNSSIKASNASDWAGDKLSYQTFGGGPDAIDRVNASFDGSYTELTIPINKSLETTTGITVRGLSVNASASAEDARLSVRTAPNKTLGSVTRDSNTTAIDVTKPKAELNGKLRLIPGATNQTNFSNEYDGDRFNNGEGFSIGVDIESSADSDIGAGTEIVISTNNSGVTFNTFANTTKIKSGNGTGSSGDVDYAEVNENNITLPVNTDFDSGDSINVTSIGFNVSSDIADETDVGIDVTTKGESSSPDIVSDVTPVMRVDRPDVSYSGDTIKVDDDGVNKTAISNVSVTSAVQGDIANYTNVTVKLLGDTGVTFNTSANDYGSNLSFADGGFDNNNQAPPYSASLAKNVTNPKNVTVNVTGVNQTDAIDFGFLAVNATPSASNTTIAVTTVPENGSTVTTELDNQIVIEEAEATIISGEPDISDDNPLTGGSFGSDNTDPGSVTKPTVDKGITGAVQVKNGGLFGGKDVDLSIVETPTESEGASLNDTTVTTNSAGEAFFNFTAGDTTGDYVVNATIAGTETGINFTYDAQPGSLAGVNVSLIENAIATETGEDLSNASFYINATDEFGNKLAAGGNPTVTITSGTLSPSNIQISDDLSADGKGTEANTNGLASDGEFSLDGDGSSVAEVNIDTAQDVTLNAEIQEESDSDTATFYSSVGAVNLSLNRTSTVKGGDVKASAEIAEDDGTTIVVPDVQVTIKEQGTSNTTLGTTTADTNNDGVATTTFSADAEGPATIRAKNNLKTSDVTLNIGTPSLSVSTDQDEVTVGTQTDVTTTVTYATNDSAVSDATVSLSGAGVSVSDQLTDSNGNATFTINASSAGDITVNATKDGTELGQTTIEAVEPAAVPVTDFQVSGLQPADGSATKGDTVSVSATVENTGEASGTQTVEFRLDTNGDDQLDASEELLNKSVQLDSGASTTVEFSVDTSIDAIPNESATYAHGVFSANDSAEGTLTIEPREPTAGPSDVTGNDLAPTNVDDDNLYEDVNGDGEVNFADLTALYSAFSNDRINSSNSQFFNFNGEEGVDFPDITALYAQEIREDS
jgi:hypothetical protein